MPGSCGRLSVPCLAAESPFVPIWSTRGSRALPRAERSRSYGVLPIGFRSHRGSHRPAQPAQAPAPPGDESASLRREAFQTPGPLVLELRMPAGEIRGQASDRAETVVEPDAAGSRDEVRQTIEQARIEIRPRGDGHVVIVDVRPRRRFGMLFDRGDITMRVSCPNDAHVELSPASADVEMRGRFGALSAEVASGDLRADELNGRVDVKSASGDVALDLIGDDASVATASGDV